MGSMYDSFTPLDLFDRRKSGLQSTDAQPWMSCQPPRYRTLLAWSPFVMRPWLHYPWKPPQARQTAASRRTLQAQLLPPRPWLPASSTASKRRSPACRCPTKPSQPHCLREIIVVSLSNLLLTELLVCSHSSLCTSVVCDLRLHEQNRLEPCCILLCA